jgi:hypothetical protein
MEDESLGEALRRPREGRQGAAESVTLAFSIGKAYDPLWVTAGKTVCFVRFLLLS